MKVGAALHIYWDDKRKGLEYVSVLNELAEMGFYSAEFLCDSGFYPMWGTEKVFSETRKIKKIIDRLGIKATIHAPHYDFNIATNNSGLMDEMVKQVKDCVRVAEILGSDIVVLHPGRISSKKFPRDLVLERAIEFLSGVESFAGGKNVKICLENETLSTKSLCSLPEEMKYVIDAVDSKNVRVCLDIAHVNTTKKPLSEFLRLLKKQIYHIHISDNVGDSHHLPIGKGNIDFKKTIRELEPYSGILNIEGWVTDGRRENLEKGRKYLLALMKQQK
ncbi:MAG: sugar phosphate isomerase/epimerase [Candidatus Altiarchaeota archaeon]|nr:sugar phosphate isomerase/epimerase [Candidatus Altiarchaeota archaeon]